MQTNFSVETLDVSDAEKLNRFLLVLKFHFLLDKAYPWGAFKNYIDKMG